MHTACISVPNINDSLSSVSHALSTRLGRVELLALYHVCVSAQDNVIFIFIVT